MFMPLKISKILLLLDEVFHFKYDIVNFKTHLMKKNCEKTTDSGFNSKLRYIPC